MTQVLHTPSRPETAIYPSALHIKFMDASFASAALLIFINIPLGLVPFDSLDRIISFYPLYLLLYTEPIWWLLPVGVGLMYSLYWHRQEKTGQIDHTTSRIRHARCREGLCLSLALLISSYGFAKLLGNQLTTTMFQQDMRLADMEGGRLTWSYFAFAPLFVYLIGLIQILGAVLLLYRRTHLLALFVLMPVMLNILLINYFYKITTGALVNSVLITSGLLYLLLLHWAKLKEFFFQTVRSIPTSRRTTLKQALRGAVLLLAFADSFQYHIPYGNGVWNTVHDQVLQGKWQIDRQVVDGVPVQPFAWASDTTMATWSTVYFERKLCVLSANPYFYAPTQARRGEYTFDADKRTLDITFNGTDKDHFTGIVSSIKGNKMTVEGLYKNKKVSLALTRVKARKG